jgi:cyclic pyranopterin phosphate synthase
MWSNAGGNMETDHKTGQFTHFDSSGNAIMVDISSKESGSRMAIAQGLITVNEQTLQAIKSGNSKKGDVLAVARIAGITGAKKTSSLIPLCHSLSFDTCTVDFSVLEATRQIKAVCTVKLTGKTGAEMEALTGVSVALLTIYDMCKAMDRGMTIGTIRLVEKSGGASGHFIQQEK